MPNTNFQTFHQMGQAINEVVRQATGRDNVQNIDMEHITVAQNHYYQDVDVSGPVVSFHAGAAGFPLEKCVVQIEPVQDLHGYDHPWPAGGGKNKINLGSPYTFTTTIDQQIDTIPQGTAWIYRDSFSYTTTPASGAKNPYVVFYDENDNSVGGIWVNPNEKTSSVSLTGDAVKVRIYSNGYNYSDSTGVEVTITGLAISTTEVSAYEPYSNICPIIGWGSAEVQRTGINIWNEETQNGYYHTNDGIFIPYSNQLCSKNFIAVKPNTTYIFCKSFNLGDILYYDVDKTYLSFLINRPANEIFTTPDNCYFININLGARYGATYNHDVSINYPATDTQYHPGTQNATYHITFPSEAGTVYGGTLDVVSGVLVVDRMNIASYNGETLPGKWISDRDVYVEGATPTTGAQVVYELATPVTYTFTPQEVTTLLGLNHVWADAGDIEVKFKDLKELY